jgi:hypothetical protein
MSKRTKPSSNSKTRSLLSAHCYRAFELSCGNKHLPSEKRISTALSVGYRSRRNKCDCCISLQLREEILGRRSSQVLPKFESYRCSRNSLNFLTKLSNAYEQFHGIGRLVSFAFFEPDQTGRAGRTNRDTPSVTTLEIEIKGPHARQPGGRRGVGPRAARPIEPPPAPYYKGKLAGIGRNAIEAEDLIQEAVLAFHIKRRRASIPTYLSTRPIQHGA